MTKKKSYKINSLKKTQQIIERDSQKNIKKIVFPNNVQIGAGDSLPSTLNVGGEIKGFIHTLSDGTTPYILAQGGIAITSSSNGQIIISGSGGSGGGGGGLVTAITNGGNNRIATFEGLDGLNGEANLTFDGDHFVCHGSASFSEHIYHIADFDTFIRFDDNSIFLTAGERNFLAVSGSDDGKLGDKITFMSGGHPSSFDEAACSDVSFYVSGSVNSRGTLERGTSVFGGDVVASGSISAGNNVIRDRFGNKKIEFTNTGMVLSSSYGVEDFDRAVIISQTGMQVTYALNVGSDLLVEDYGRINALSVGTTGSDPGNNTLRVNGRSELAGKTTVTGSLIAKSDAIISGSLYVTSDILPGSTPLNNQVIAWSSSQGKLIWRTVSSTILLAFAFDSGIPDFTVSDMAMTAFASMSAFNPSTSVVTVSGSYEPTS